MGRASTRLSTLIHRFDPNCWRNALTSCWAAAMDRIQLSKDLTEQGYSYAEIARKARRAELVRVRRGAYADPPESELRPRAMHLRLLAATLGQSSPDAVVSHVSAAALHGLPIWTEHLGRVHLTRDRAGQGKVRRYVQIHGARLAPSDIVDVEGFRVTSVARTVVDLACTLSMLQAVSVGDAALRAGLRREALTEVLAQAGRRHGVADARRCIAFLDPRAESPGESMSRVVLFQQGMPAPEPQFEVFDAGHFVARSDFGWEKFRTLGEFDGKVKYGQLLLKPGQSPEDALFEEKQREDALRDLGWQVVRWIWADLNRPAQMLDRLRRAFLRGQRAT